MRTPKKVLSVGVELCIPQSRIDPIVDEMEVEGFLRNSVIAELGWFKAKLVDLAQQYRTASSKEFGLLMNKHIRELINLKRNKDLVIIQRDKGSGVMLLKHTDYVGRINSILSTAQN